ncbi:MAG: PH domain-containing protein [Planctomycetaceae bacterium]
MGLKENVGKIALFPHSTRSMPDVPLPDERPIATVYPSVASLAIGRAFGALYESIPLKIGRLKLSHLLFPLPTSPFVLLVYIWLKTSGSRYVLTTQRLRHMRGLTAGRSLDMPLDEVGRIEVVTSFGQRFYKAGDLVVHDHLGAQRLRFPSVVRPEMFRQTILDARDALINTDAAQRIIEARRTSGAA